MDKISVIMSTYKEPIEWIRRAIESILNQTYKNLEFIIVVDAPTYKELISLLNNYKDKDDRVKVVVNDSNIGLVENLNKRYHYAMVVMWQEWTLMIYRCRKD